MHFSPERRISSCSNFSVILCSYSCRRLLVDSHSHSSGDCFLKAKRCSISTPNVSFNGELGRESFQAGGVEQRLDEGVRSHDLVDQGIETLSGLLLLVNSSSDDEPASSQSDNAAAAFGEVLARTATVARAGRGGARLIERVCNGGRCLRLPVSRSAELPEPRIVGRTVRHIERFAVALKS